MSKFISAVQAFVSDENGVTAIEYGLIAALIGVAMVAGATLLGDNLDKVFKKVANAIVAPAAAPPAGP